MNSTSASWAAIMFETLPWHYDSEALAGISKTARRRIAPTYEAAIPFELKDKTVVVQNPLAQRISELMVHLVRFDEMQRQRSFNLPALLLRSESAASSQIENLTSSARNIALAEVCDTAPSNAQLIAGNIAAMKEALAFSDELNIEEILRINSVLMNRNGYALGGKLREEQVWVGGYPYSPHGAIFVPPQASRVRSCLDDLVLFAKRDDVAPVEKAAIVHAQFETIHPFIDGNGRTGRTILHKVLRREGVLTTATLPVSAGLLHNIDAYMKSLTAYQQGDPDAVIEQLVGALELAIAIGEKSANHIEALIAAWEDEISERSTSNIHKLPNVLVAQPVVDSKYLAATLDITQRAAKALINRACEYGMLRPISNRRRGEFYQSDGIIDLLDDLSSIQGIRRLFAHTY